MTWFGMNISSVKVKEGKQKMNINTMAIKDNMVNGYSITWGVDFFDVISFGNQLSDMFIKNGFTEAKILDSGYYEDPEYPIKWGLGLPFLSHPLEFMILETKEEEKEDLYFELNSRDNEMTSYQLRWILHHLMMLVTEGDSDPFHSIALKILENKPILDEAMEWER